MKYKLPNMFILNEAGIMSMDTGLIVEINDQQHKTDEENVLDRFCAKVILDYYIIITKADQIT